ncbi:MAG: bifunctional riboflavin kinase/FAD synthetase [Bacteroidales bacterium]|nr:bifunctional riboflavin kinase/FAD synthetase [Bacteroidales bacterium]MDD7276813.1 bifunctional riboflavin kinase/FAD synthetase [Bacteroidales bacterium]MDY6074842.1 bifunctional riboflavin kinase/FAD synthetase [Bacteroidales bacterium]
MKVYHDIKDFRKIPNAIVTIGTFDGVHLGHQAVFKQMVDKARQIGGETVVITFFPHPRIVISPNDNRLRLITSQEDKIEHLRRSNIDNLIIINFTKEFSHTSSEDFIKDYVVRYIQPAILVIGYDHHFGSNRSGDFDTLSKLGMEFHFAVEKINEQDIEDITISSTKIRSALQQGDIKLANKLLGYSYSTSGIVTHGDSIGRTLGFPTANISIKPEYQLIEKTGVYATIAKVDGKDYPSMTYIGRRPTISNGLPTSTETYIMDFDGDLYGKEIRVTFVDRVRDEMTFDNLERLKSQIQEDKANIIRILSNIN